MAFTVIPIDVRKFRRFPGSPLIISLMMMANDLERIAYYRLLCASAEPTGFEYFSQHTGAYNMCLFSSHLYEALELIQRIKGSKDLGRFISGDPELSPLYSRVKGIDSSPLRETLRALRNMVSFHYKLNADRLRRGLDDILAAGFETDQSIIGIGNTPTMHELAQNAYDAMVLDMIGGKYDGTSPTQCRNGKGCDPSLICNHVQAKIFLDELEEAQRHVRFFASALIKRFINHVHSLSHFELGYLGIDWSK